MTKTRPIDVPLPPIHQDALTRLEACSVARRSPRRPGTSTCLRTAAMGKKRRLADVPMPRADAPFLTRLEACKIARLSEWTFDKAVAEKRRTVRWNGARI